LIDTDRREHSEILRSQSTAGAEHDSACPNVLATLPDMFSRRYFSQGKNAIALDFDFLRREDGVCALRQRSAGHNSRCLAGSDRYSARLARKDFADHVERQSIVR
jgi:hypothetical protein